MFFAWFFIHNEVKSTVGYCVCDFSSMHKKTKKKSKYWMQEQENQIKTETNQNVINDAFDLEITAPGNLES